MSALTEFLFPAPAKRTAGGILMWWEKRRLAYNAAVGSAGIVAVIAAHVFTALPPAGVLSTDVGWIPVAGIFGVMANVCYLLGPTTEILIDKIWGRGVLPTGPALYRMGLTFSVGLALFPALITGFMWVARIVMAIF